MAIGKRTRRILKFAKRNPDGSVTLKTKGATGRPGGTTIAASTPGTVPARDMGGSSPKLIRPKNREVPRNQPNSTEQ